MIWLLFGAALAGSVAWDVLLCNQPVRFHRLGEVALVFAMIGVLGWAGL
jgi:hypothetical protein